MGRGPLLAQLGQVFEQACAGTPGLVLVEGPAGIGKTALVRTFLDEAAGGCVLRASGEASEVHLPFGVWPIL